MNKSNSVMGVRLAALVACAGMCLGSGCEERTNVGASGETSSGNGEEGAVRSVNAPPTEEEMQKRYAALVEEFHPQFLVEEPNAWDEFAGLLRDFHEKYKPRAATDTEPYKDLFNITSQSDQVTKAEFDAAMEMLAGVRADGFFERTGALVGKRRFVSPAPQRPFINEVMPELGQVRNLTRAQNARMMVAFSKNDYEEAARAYEEILVMSLATAYKPIMLSRLVSVAVANVAIRGVREELNRREVPTVFLERIKRATLDWEGSYPRFDICMRGEELMMLDTAAHLSGPEGKGGKVDPARAKVVEEIGALAGLRELGSYKETEKTVQEFFARAKVYITKPRLERLSMKDPMEILAPFSPTTMLIGLLAPATERSFQADESLKVDVAGLLTMVGIELYRAKHAALPGQLLELVPGELSELPRDPLANVGDSDQNVGGDLVYRVSADERSKRGYVLYSVGADGKDDGGKAATETFTTLRDKGDGTDYVFTNPEIKRPAIERRDTLK